MRLLDFVRARTEQVRRSFTIPFAPGNPFQQKEPYDFFRLVGPYPPGWHRQSNFGTVERLPPRYPEATVPAVSGPIATPRSLPQRGTVPSIRPLAEKGEPFTFFQRMPASGKEPYDTSFRGQIGAPRHLSMQNEVYDFTY